MNEIFQAHKRKRDDASEDSKESKKVKSNTKDPLPQHSKAPTVQDDAAEPNLLMSPYDLYLSPWEHRQIPEELPPLPKVLDKTLEAAAFIHQGLANGKSTDLTYERLEWVGDAYIYQFSTLIISKTFPTLLPGKCSQLREMCVKNITLAGYAREYGFENRLVLPKHFLDNPHKVKKEEKIKIMGDVFEAYVAAVILSDPVDGLKRAAQWLWVLWGQTIKRDIEHEERKGDRYKSPMWFLRGEEEATRTIGQPAKLNAKDQLRQMIGCKGVRLDYKVCQGRHVSLLLKCIKLEY